MDPENSAVFFALRDEPAVLHWDFHAAFPGAVQESPEFLDVLIQDVLVICFCVLPEVREGLLEDAVFNTSAIAFDARFLSA